MSDDAVTTSMDGRAVILTCQNPACGAVSTPIRLIPTPSGNYWCGLCGEWGFDFDLVGLTEEQTWPDRLALVDIGPLGPEGVDGGHAVLNVTPRWAKPE